MGNWKNANEIKVDGLIYGNRAGYMVIYMYSDESEYSDNKSIHKPGKHNIKYININTDET